METLLNQHNEKLAKKLNSLSIAFLLTAAGTTEILAKISFLRNVQNNVFILAGVLALAFFRICVVKKFYLQISAIVCSIWLILIYATTQMFNSDQCDLTVVQFIFYGLLPVYVISQKFDSELVLRYILYFSLLTLPVSNNFFRINHVAFSQAYLGNMFVILSPIIVTIIHFSLYRKTSNILVKMAYVYNLYLLVMMLLYANRGAVLCILFSILVLTLNTYDENKLKIMSTKKLLTVIILLIVVAVAILNAVALLEWLADVTKSLLGSTPSFIAKTLRYIAMDDISDGRSDIFSFTIQETFKQPIFGNGVKTFHAYVVENTSKVWPYPHNYILQYFFECGLIFGLPQVYLSLSLCFKTFFRQIKDKKEFAICCTLFCINIPKLLVSTDPWANTSIWMLIAYSLNYIMDHNKYFIALNNDFKNHNIR